MTILSGQSIRRRGIVTPHCERTRDELSGMTYGLGPSGYDVRIAEDVILSPPWMIDRIGYQLGRRSFVLASTIERFHMPTDVVARVHDKSTLARLGLALQNTIAEPGWSGHLTLELSYSGDTELSLSHGMPIAQIIFELLDEPAERPYVGRYQNQEAGPQPARLLRGDEERF